jgi:hypothetical protein
MVDAQLACQAARPARRMRVLRGPKPPRAKPEVLSRLDDLVCVVGEANAWPYDRTKGKSRVTTLDELVHWVAWRPSGETFEAICAPQGALSPSTTFHTRLPEAQLLAASSRDDLYAAFAKFLRPTDVVGAWGFYGLNLFDAALPARVDLRAVVQRIVNKKLGGIEPFAASLGAPLPPLGAGRAGVRLAALAQIVKHYSST